MNFSQATQYLLSLGHETLTIKLGLRNTELLLESLGNPQQQFEAVQIAGTNGKGSTAVMLDSICRAAGISTGLYTSPHLLSITERIKINGQDISEEDFADLSTAVKTAADKLVADGKLEALPTFFEHVTAIAILAFKEAAVDLAILETGLGGRLDATTAAAAKTIAITPVSLDHQEYLGETLAEIAFEKGSIIRPGVTAIIANQSPEVHAVILRRCRDCDVEPIANECRVLEVCMTTAGLFHVTFESQKDLYENVHVPLAGRHQVGNAGLAIQIAESLRARGFAISKTAIVNGVEGVRHLGRLSRYADSHTILLDGAHNPAAATALREYLDAFVKAPLTLVFGAMSDKKVAEIAAILFPGTQKLILTQPHNPRAASVERLQIVAEGFLPRDKIIAVPEVADALKKAREVTPPQGVICATGSLYLVGEVAEILGLVA